MCMLATSTSRVPAPRLSRTLRVLTRPSPDRLGHSTLHSLAHSPHTNPRLPPGSSCFRKLQVLGAPLGGADALTLTPHRVPRAEPPGSDRSCSCCAPDLACGIISNPEGRHGLPMGLPDLLLAGTGAMSGRRQVMSLLCRNPAPSEWRSESCQVLQA